MEWYGKFRRDCALFSIPFLPFNAIVPKYEANAFFLPELGLRLFDMVGRVIMPILEAALPTNDVGVNAQVRLINGTSNNAYELLWKLTTVMIPIFDTTRPVVLPAFDDCIFRFAQRHTLSGTFLPS